MPAKVRVDPINLDFSVLLDPAASDEMRSTIVAEFAQGVIEDAKAQNAKVLGRAPPYTVAVDGRLGAPLAAVKPNGVIFVEFELVFEALQWIGEMLKQYSPVGSGPKDKHPGLYQQSHVLIADGVAVEDGAVPPIALEYVWVNLQPYARKIERGLSPQRPDGVYQAVAQLAASSSRFGNVARIKFGYRTPLFGAIDKWAASPAGAAWARLKRKGRPDLHAEWLRRQPAIIITMPG